ncbi:MAG TPA: hypothetical protein VLE73_05315 [Candidatus Saccharimonadales bacterium]|nr:hypothetical protein [Candidatus Saccharimonadales bacterium]
MNNFSTLEDHVVTICSSASFYRQVVDLQEKLKKMGVNAVVPDMAHEMKRKNDYDVTHYKTWYEDDGDYHKKAKLMHGHFDKVAAGDSVLIVNFEKNGKPNYIGANVLMEMALAFHLNKPIFILNELPENSPFEEEIKGMTPIVLHGKLQDLPKHIATV